MHLEYSHQITNFLNINPKVSFIIKKYFPMLLELDFSISKKGNRPNPQSSFRFFKIVRSQLSFTSEHFFLLHWKIGSFLINIRNLLRFFFLLQVRKKVRANLFYSLVSLLSLTIWKVLNGRENTKIGKWILKWKYFSAICLKRCFSFKVCYINQ